MSEARAHKFSVVSKEESQQDPYPYVLVADDGSYCELEIEDKEYLQQEFSGGDGARPYVKSRYWSKTPDGKLGGYLNRKKLPKSLVVGKIPPPRKWWQL